MKCIEADMTLNDVSDFYVMDACIGCGTCEMVCHGRAIKLIGGKPIWGDNGIKCLACLYLCPKQTIQFGQYTVDVGRYKNPNIKLSELMINKGKSTRQGFSTSISGGNEVRRQQI